MSDSSSIAMSRGLPESIIPPSSPAWMAELDTALQSDEANRRAAVGAVVAEHPRFLEGWANLAEMTVDDVEAYAYARVGYHRGLDALRGAGWRGTGFVRWREETNRGFLRCLDALRQRAGAIGELDEEERCRQFCYQLDPEWARSAQ